MTAEGIPSTTCQFLPAADTRGYRFLVLAFVCLFSFGSYFCFDLPSVLESSLIDELGLTPFQYNMFYSVYSWSNMLMVIVAGLLVDKLGYTVCVFIFSALVCTGQIIFAYGGTIGVYPLMLLGRIVFGTGGGSIVVAQNTIVSAWFSGKELALAFGLGITSSRLGSVLNFLISSNLAQATSLQFALWFGTSLCILSFSSAFAFWWLDVRATRELGQSVKAESRKFEFKLLKEFPITFWLLCLICGFFYCGIFPFIADAPDFFTFKFQISRTDAAYYAGIAYDLSLFLSPLFGRSIDMIGMRISFTLVAASIQIIVYMIFAFTLWNPAVGMVLLGISYSIGASSIWGSIPLVVPKTAVGTANGFTTSVQMGIIAIWNILVGSLAPSIIPGGGVKGSWTNVMLLLYGTAIFVVVLCLLWYYFDWKRGRVLESKAVKDATPFVDSSIINETDPFEDYDNDSAF